MHFNNTTQATTRSSLIKVSSLVCCVVLSGNTRYLLTTKIKPVSQTYSVYIRNLLLFATEQKYFTIRNQGLYENEQFDVLSICSLHMVRKLKYMFCK